MTGTLSSNPSLPPLAPFTLDEETYRPPQLRRLEREDGFMVVGPSAADVEDTRAGSVFGALAAQAMLPEIPALPSARVTHA